MKTESVEIRQPLRNHTGGTTYQRAENVVTRAIAGETLLVPISGTLADMEHIFSLDEVSAFIWNHMDGTISLDRLVDLVVSEFDVERPQAASDLNELVDALLDANLIGKT